jgi:Ras-related protein Rab-11A
VGESYVGKSNLISRFSYDRFSKETRPTIGVEFANKAIEYDGVILRSQLWDTAGQESMNLVTIIYIQLTVLYRI